MVAGRRVLVSVDDSEASEKAVSWVVQDFFKPGDTVELVHVVLYAASTTYPATQRSKIDVENNPLGLIDAGSKEYIQAQKFIDKRFKPLLEAANIKYTVNIVQNFSQAERVANALIRVADGLHVNIIVIGKYHKGLDKLLHGSTASALLTHAKVPVLVMR